MTKRNPLFVDSTRLHGDLIATQFELRSALIYDDEVLFVVVTNDQGISMRVQMKAVPEGDGYEARVHLNLQTPITYQFIIEGDGRRLLQSMAQKTRVQYAIVEEWLPVLGDPADARAEESVQDSPVRVAQLQGQRPNAAWARDSSMSVRSLIEKWGL